MGQTGNGPLPAWVTAGANVQIWHGERPDGRLLFMYSLIVGTLRDGFEASGAHVSVNQIPHAHSLAHNGFGGSLSVLRRGDAFVWVGPKQHATPPWALLGQRGVRRLYYQTEPLSGGCFLPPYRKAVLPSMPLRDLLVDEIFDYSRSNLEHCRRHPDAPPLRYLPPGYTRAAWAWGPRLALGPELHGSAQLAADSSPRGESAPRALFLGDPDLEERARCFDGLRALVRPVNHIWNVSAFRTLCDGSVAIFVNVHKRCTQSELTQPFEAVRAAQVLSAGGLLLSQRAHPADEAEYAGLVEFHSLPQLRTAVVGLLARSNLRRTIAQRMSAFRSRFAPAELYARSALNVSAVPAYSRAEREFTKPGRDGVRAPPRRPARGGPSAVTGRASVHAGRSDIAGACRPQSDCCRRHPRVASCHGTAIAASGRAQVTGV